MFKKAKSAACTFKHFYDYKLTSLNIVNDVAWTVNINMIVIDESMIVNDDYWVVNYTPRVMPQFGASVQRAHLWS